MTILRTKEIRDMSHQDRQKRLGEMQTELIRLRTMIKAGGSIDNPARVRELRKTIARLLTIDSEPTPIKKEEKKPKKEQKKKPKKKQKRQPKEGTEK